MHRIEFVRMGTRKESVLDLARFINKIVRVKLAGGREGGHSPSSGLQTFAIYLMLLIPFNTLMWLI